LAAAALQDGIYHRTAPTGFRVPYEHPIFLSNATGTDGIFHQVVVDLDMSAFQAATQRLPVIERVGNALKLGVDEVQIKKIYAALVTEMIMTKALIKD